MNACDEKLREALMEAWKKEDARLREELERNEPHVFSEKFEQKMQKLMNGEMEEESPCWFQRKSAPVLKFVAAIVVGFILVGGTFLSKSNDLQASNLSIDILQWLDKFFTVEDGDAGKTQDSVLFDESQIGYLPEGFKKVSEGKAFSQVNYEFRNAEDVYIIFKISRDVALTNIDNESITKEVHLNKAGYEYTIIHKKDSKEIVVIWKDEKEIYFYIESILNEEEILKIMDGMS